MRPDQSFTPLEPATLTMLFTDIVGCTTLIRELGPDAAAVIEGHERAVRTATEAAGGVVGEEIGDSMLAVFPSASRAVTAAVEAQRRLAATAWPQGASVAVRMGLDTGEPTAVNGRYYGRAVNRASSICEAAHGGQILLSLVTRELADEGVGDEIGSRDLGEHRVGDDRLRLFQVLAPGLEESFPAPRRVGHVTTGFAFPAGTVTFLFTDIEDSTFLTRVLGDEWHIAHADHRSLVRAAAIAGGGQEVDNQGDSFFFAFPRARDAAAAAVAAQTALASHSWPRGVPLRVRMGLHTGEPEHGAEGYLGLDVVRGARVCAIADGGEVLLSETTQALLVGEELAGARLEELGVHRLKGLNEDHRLFRLVIDGLPVDRRSGRTRVATLTRALPLG
jgi:class 3 adenylate cyclase